MTPQFPATRRALEQFDRVDQPEFLRPRDGRSPYDEEAFMGARHAAADRVRAAFLEDTGHFNTPEIVELMSVDTIRRSVGGTLLGRMLGLLP